jgi:hypothetical protein
MQKLMIKSKFAQLAGVNASTMTRVSKTILKDAFVGKHIDAAHPLAVQYIADKKRDLTPSAAPGIDNRYEEVVARCQEAGKFSAYFIIKEFNFGSKRARLICNMMAVSGLSATKVAPTPPPPPVEIKAPPAYIRGPKAARETKKREAEQENEIVEIPEDIQAFADMTLRELIEKFGTDFRFIDWLSAIQKIEAINEKRLKNAETEGKLVSRRLVKVGILEPIDACHIKLLTDGAKTIARRVTAMHSAETPLDEIEKFVAEQITSFIKPVKAKVARALNNA